MRIRVKLMGMLKDRTPPNGELEVSDGATIEDVLHTLNVPAETVQVFSVNGSIQRDRGHALGDGDDLTVLPPVGGG